MLALSLELSPSGRQLQGDTRRETAAGSTALPAAATKATVYDAPLAEDVPLVVEVRDGGPGVMVRQ